MRYQLLLTLLFLFGVIVSFGQSKSKKKKLKREHFVASSITYRIGKPNQISFEERSNLNSQVTETKLVWTERSNYVFGATYRRQKDNGRYFEIGVDELYCQIKSIGTQISLPNLITEPTSGLESLDGRLKGRYELGKISKFSNSERCSWGIGLALQPFVIYSRTAPKTSQGFPTTRFSYGAEFKATALFQYQLNERLGFNMKWLPQFFSIQQAFFKIRNERLTRSQQTQQRTITGFDLARHTLLIQFYLKLKGKGRK